MEKMTYTAPPFLQGAGSLYTTFTIFTREIAKIFVSYDTLPIAF
jgi:hypothetical protein